MKKILFLFGCALSLCGSEYAQAQTYSSSAAVSFIADASCPGVGTPSSSVINVPVSGTISTPSDVFIDMNLASGCSATIKVVLVSPSGDSCIILNMPFRTGGCTGSCFVFNTANTLSFNSTYTTTIPATSPIPAGNYAPTASTFAPAIGDLSTFLSGKSINGNWQLLGSADASWDGSIDSWSIVFGATALPLNLISFSGRGNQTYNEINWSTGSERNTSSFDVQRSTDGISYKTVGQVAAKGSGNNYYSFSDQSISSEVSIYRLRMIDIDGQYTYSPTLRIAGRYTGQAGIRFSPNPVKGEIEIESLDNADAEGNIINSLGQSVLSFTIKSGKQKFNIDYLPDGIYYLKFTNGDLYRFSKTN